MHTLRSFFQKKKRVFLFAAFSFLAASTLCSQGIRKPVWAGLFYPKDPKVLSDQIDHFLKNTKEASKITGEIKALIAPHAGYVYSGQVAAEAYRLVQGKPVDTVVILSPCHRHGFYGASIYIKGGYETPLGVVKIDEQLARELSDKTGFQYVPAAHREEHAIEVQIPFIQKTLPEAKIVPVIMGIPSQKTIKKLASALASVTYGKNVLILASTDMSHFLSKAQAKETDIRTISLIKSFQIDQLIKKLEQRENIMCGGAPVVTLLLFAKTHKKPKIKLLSYADSSDHTGSPARVVGYMSAALITENHIQPFSLSRDEKDELLRIARVSISQFLKEKKFPVFNPVNIILLTKKGAFVTLKKEGRLRGCIGFIEPIRPLYKTVIQAALYAAFQDTRFLPVTTQELNSLEIEISVLSPLEKIHDPENINVGRHGLYLLKNGRSGLLLPQVAVENGWSREMFLRQVCRKAGLPVNAWKTDSEIFIFEAVVFH
jgi:AmmeMemoRadiSam system protein B/AmmeMemoRadiSam system protein A